MAVANTVSDDVYDVAVHCTGSRRPRVARVVDGVASVDLAVFGTVTVVVYGTTAGLDEDRLVGTSPIGCAIVSRWSQWLPLLDIDRYAQGKVRVTVCGGSASQGAPRGRSTERPLTGRLIAADKRWYTDHPGGYDPDTQAFFDVNTFNGVVPLVAFPLLSTALVLESAADRFLLHSTRLACDMADTDPMELDRLSTYELANLAGQVMSLLPGCQLYVNDFRRIAQHGKEYNEQWSQLLTYPSLHSACFDCEDGCMEILAVGHSLQLRESPYAPVQVLQKLLRRYSLGSVQGELKTGRRYVGHSYCLCLDARRVDSWLRGRDDRPDDALPPLVVESTSWQESAWDQRRWQLDEYRAFHRRCERADALVQRGSNLLNRCVRPYLSSLQAYEKGTYGKLAKIQFANHRGRVLCVAVTDDSGESMSVPLASMLFESSTRILVLSHLTKDETAELGEELRDQPAWALPDVPADVINRLATADNFQPNRARFQCRTLDWPRVHGEFTELLRSERLLAASRVGEVVVAPPDCSFVCVETTLV